MEAHCHHRRREDWKCAPHICEGASAELAADYFGLPVSTTHVLSSGVAGTMAANHSGLQTQTLRNLLLAWVLTLPVCIFLGAVLFASGFYIVLNVLGLK